MSAYDALLINSDLAYVKCKLCDKRLSRSGGTSNIRRHMVRYHIEQLEGLSLKKIPVLMQRKKYKPVLQHQQSPRVLKLKSKITKVRLGGPSRRRESSPVVMDHNIGRVTMDGYIIMTSTDICRFCVAWRENMRDLDDEEKRWLGPDDQWITCPICPRCARKIRKDRFEDFFARANEASELLSELHRRFANASLPIDIQGYPGNQDPIVEEVVADEQCE